jgi:hypothetical protein
LSSKPPLSLGLASFGLDSFETGMRIAPRRSPEVVTGHLSRHRPHLGNLVSTSTSHRYWSRRASSSDSASRR